MQIKNTSKAYIIALFLSIPFCAFNNNWHFIQKSFNYDSLNIFTWAYARHLGYKPIIDTWYPYGIQFYINRSYPLGSLMLFSTNVITAAAILYYAKTLLGRGDKLILLLLCLVTACFLLDVNPDFRYLISLALVLLNNQAAASNGKICGVFLFFYSLLAIFYEANQYIYSTLSLGFVYSIIYFNAKKIESGLRRIFLINVAVIFTSVIITYSIVGSDYRNLSNFYLQMESMAIYGTIPISLSYLLGNFNSFIFLGFILFATPIIALQLSYISKIQTSTSVTLPLVWALLAVVAQKELVRPDMSYQVNAFVIYAISLVLVEKLSSSKIIITAIISAASLFFFFSDYSYRYLEKVHQTIEIFNLKKNTESYNSLSVLYSKTNLIYDKFDYNRFKSEHSDYNSIYVLGDNSLIYIGLDAPLPPVINLYNTSPVYLQEATINWLKERNVQYILSEKSRGSFDSVPDLVRLPLLYHYIAKNYVFDSAIGEYTVYKLAHNANMFSDWVPQFGTFVDYKHAIQSLACSDPKESLRLNNLPGRANVTIEFSDGFLITFSSDNSNNVCIQLSRIWFFDKNIAVKRVLVDGVEYEDFYVE